MPMVPRVGKTTGLSGEESNPIHFADVPGRAARPRDHLFVGVRYVPEISRAASRGRRLGDCARSDAQA